MTDKRWEQFERATFLPLAVNKHGEGALAVPGILHGPYAAAKRLMETPIKHPGDLSNADAAKLVGDGMVAGPGALSPGYARAMAGASGVELGALGSGRRSPLADREFVDHLVELVARTGDGRMTKTQMAAELSKEHGRELSVADVFTAIRALQRKGELPRTGGGEFELGALGGAGKRITPDDVVTWFNEAGVPVTAVKTAGKDGTVYIKFEAPNNPRAQGDAAPTVRIPMDEAAHQGRGLKASERGNVFDTAVPEAHKDARAVLNAGGESYSTPEALEAALKWRTSSAPKGENWLVRPDQAPRDVRHAREPAPVMPAEAASPDQLKLLGSGGPPLAPVIKPRMETPQPDARVLEMMERMRQERELEEMKRRAPPKPPTNQWDQFQRAPQ